MSTLMPSPATPGTSRWPQRLLTLLLAALAAASAWFWLLHWPAPATDMGGRTVSPAPAELDPAQVARLLGAAAASSPAAAPVAAPSNYQLLGVIAPGSAGQRHSGSALIAVDGAPARPFRVGEAVTGQLVLQSVQPRSAVLAPDLQAPGTLTLTLPLLDGMTDSN